MSAKRLAPTSVKQSRAPNSWMDALRAININDENWRCAITMIVETLPEHSIYVDLFDEAADGGARKAIYSLTSKKVANSVRTLSKADQDKCPPAQTVFHQAKKLMSQGESLEASLIAGLVKYLVYRAKMESLARTKTESDLDGDIDKELRAMLTVAKVESQPSMKPAKSTKSGQSTEAPPTEKATTHLRKRGEEWRDKVYIDDAPEDGPDLYVLLTGFRDPGLPLELIRAELPLTCILRIKPPGEETESGEADPAIDEDVTDHSGKIVGGSVLTRKILRDFWSTLDRSANHPANLEDYSGVIFQTFCPPVVGTDDADAEASRKDLYDRVSCIVYDLYDLQRLHVDYIRSMKLQKIPIESPREFPVYTKIMDSLPTECAFVSVIMQAMLAQVESDLLGDRTSGLDDGPVRTSKSEIRSDVIVESKFDVGSKYPIPDQLQNHRQRIDALNQQHGLGLKEQRVRRIKDPDILLGNDNLKLKTCHIRLDDDIVGFIKPTPTSLSNLAVRSLRDTRVLGLWRNFDEIPETTKKNYRCHINKITRCFRDQMDFPRFVHYLHLQVFDKMINGGLNRIATRSEDHRVAIMEKGAVPASSRSDPFLLSSKILRDGRTFASGENPISNLRCSKSDSIIDYDKSVGDTLGCSELFYLTDTREILQPGFLESREKKLCEGRVDSSFEVADFTDVRLLTSDIFLQSIHECLEKFGGFESEYLATTDSMLLCFDHARSLPTSTTHGGDKVFQQEHRYHRVSRIVTPVCLRNFCEYVIREESEWIREMEIERAGKRSTSAGELTRKLSRHSDIDVTRITTFTDDDFILPNSLKGRARKKDEDKLSTAGDSPSKSVKLTQKTENDGKMKKEKTATLKTPTEKEKKETKTVEIDATSLPLRKVPSLRCARDDEPYKFLGYDLGSLRVQVTDDSEKFVSPDGTVVRLDLVQWLYRERTLRIGISLAGCFLKLENVVGIDNNHKIPFHLITKNGIVVAFRRARESEEISQSRSVRFDFRASWPSGLLVEPVGGDSSENPFYILQKYISKGPECGPVSRENYRKFLRNGTVLKFHDDGTVEVLRPNGAIVRCLNFEKTTRSSYSEHGRDGNLTRGTPLEIDTPDYEAYRYTCVGVLTPEGDTSCVRTQLKCPYGIEPSMYYRKRVMVESFRGNIKEQEVEIFDVNEGRAHVSFVRIAQIIEPFLQGETHSPGEQAGRVKITRYTTVEHDGRHYETVNDEVSRVFDKSLVRTSTDFEVCEKFYRREDGTQTVLNSKGELIVSFPDGTCITSGFLIEDEPLICDWSDDEFDRFFKNSRQSNPNERVTLSQFSNVSWAASSRSSTRRFVAQQDKLRILLADAFVSVLMTCRMEHMCYATVAYDQATKSCQLSMPDEVVIAISAEGLFDLSIGSDVELRIRENNLRFSSRVYEHDDQRISETIYNFPQPESDGHDCGGILLVTKDSRGNVFTIHSDGSVIRYGNSDVPLSKLPGNQCRLFAMKRDFTAHEYLRKSQRYEFQERMNAASGSSVISIPNGRAAGLEYRLFLSPLDPTNYSKMWLQKITNARRTNHDRTDVPRSTYSNPYEWIFPFGRNGNGVRKNTWKVSLGESVEEGRSGVLTLTLFQGIAVEGENLLIELQKALACYWRSMINGNEPYSECSLLLEGSATSSTSFSQAKVDKWLIDLALGIESQIDAKKYLSGVSTDRMKHVPSKVREDPKRAKFDNQNALAKSEIQWYKECVRERMILPYFKSIEGACFLWIMSCVNSALEYVEKY